MSSFFFFFFFNDTATTEIYTLSLHDALPIRSQLDRGLHDTGIEGRAARGLVAAPRALADRGVGVRGGGCPRPALRARSRGRAGRGEEGDRVSRRSATPSGPLSTPSR